MLHLLTHNALNDLSKTVAKKSIAKAVQQIAEKPLQKSANENMSALFNSRQKTSIPNDLKLCIPTLKGFVILKLQDVIMCEAQKNYTNIHLQKSNQIMVSRPLLEYEKILEGAGF